MTPSSQVSFGPTQL